MTTATASATGALAPVVDALVREPVMDWYVSERQAFLADLVPQVQRLEELPDHGGLRPQLSYVLPADWPAGQAERATCPTCSSCPEHRPPSLADTVAASLPGMPGGPAEHTCAVRGCTRPPALCDAHHLTHRADGGETSMRDLVLLCRRHHVLWQLGKITLRDRTCSGTPTPPAPGHPPV